MTLVSYHYVSLHLYEAIAETSKVYFGMGYLLYKLLMVIIPSESLLVIINRVLSPNALL